MLNKCSNISCKGIISDSTHPAEFLDIEKKYGILCSCCYNALKHNRGKRAAAVCAQCGHIVYIFEIPKELYSDVIYCEQCRVCGDAKKEFILFSAN